MILHGIPELIAAVESGQIAFTTGWNIAHRIPRDEQLPIVTKAMSVDGQHPRHGMYIRRDKTPAQQLEMQHKQHDRICEAVDKLLDAIMERADALGVCTNGVQPAPESEQGRKWRITVRHIRKALRQLEARIDWTKTQAEHEKVTEKEVHGHGIDNSQGNGNGQSGN
jgi:hypothetical protein